MDRARKRELRELNARAWTGETDVFPVSSSLDSSWKKNTAFIKRIRTSITSSPLSTFLQEIRSLSLEKYLSEIVSAAYEGLARLKTPTEVAAGVEVISALHQRFGPETFTGYLGWHIGKGLSSPDKVHLKTLSQEARDREEKDRLARQRVLLRVATELWLAGVLRGLGDAIRPEEAGKTKEAAKGTDAAARNRQAALGAKPEGDVTEPFILEVLKDLLGQDKDHVNLPLAVLLAKTFPFDIFGTKPLGSDGRKVVQDDGQVTAAVAKGVEDGGTENVGDMSQEIPITPPELRHLFRNIFSRYFEDVKMHVVRGQKAVVAQNRRNAEAYVRSGEVFEDRQANYDKQVKSQERLIASAQTLADVLGLEMPDLTEKAAAGVAGDGIIGLVKAGEYLRGQGDGAGIWEDEEERRFYENIVDLKDRVPHILLEDAKKKKVETDETGNRKATPDNSVNKDREDSHDTDAEDDQSTAIVNKSVGAQVEALLARLPEFVTKEMVDECAIDFCFVNSKASRNRVIKALQDVPKARSDLLPFYSRFVATIGKYMTDVSQGLVAYLDDEFRSLQRRKSKDFLGQVRLLNIRYLAELTKFGVVPEHVIFHCFKVCLDDFSRLNIEIISNLLENCGRYLLRNPETMPRMSSFLETLARKKAAQHLGQQERMLIENAVYHVNPPERAAIEQKERTPVDLYIRKLVYADLNKKNADRILRQIRKLHWEEPEVVALLLGVFSKPSEIKYNHIHLLAVMLGSLNRYHQTFGIAVIDNLLESITLGLEINDFKTHQRRIAEIKYLSELYIYRMIDSPLIFDTLYRVLTFGHEGGLPKAGTMNTFDLPDDYFRIRLVCSLLESCGMFFDKGQAKRKLDFFLKFFQYYIQTKDALPMDIDFLIQDTFAAVRPEWKLLTDLNAAGEAFAEAVKQNYDLDTADKGVDMEDQDDELMSDDGDDDLIALDRDQDAQSDDDDEADNTDTSDVEIHNESTSEDEEHIIVTKPHDERDPEADAEFDREYAKMMAESLESRKFERKTFFDVPLPIRRGQKEQTATENSPQNTPASATPGMMKFSLLSKRGNKQQTRDIDLPSDSMFAVAMRTQQQAEREEQRRIKDLVLNYDLREENEGSDGTRQPQNPYTQPRVDKSGNNRANQRARKLQLGDVDW